MPHGNIPDCRPAILLRRLPHAAEAHPAGRFPRLHGQAEHLWVGRGAHALAFRSSTISAAWARVFTPRTLADPACRRLYRWAFASATVFFQNRDDEQLFRARKTRARQTRPLCSRSASTSINSLPSPSSTAGQPFTFLLAARLLWDKGVREFVEAARQVRAGITRTSASRFSGIVEPPARERCPKLSFAEWDDEGVIDYLGATDRRSPDASRPPIASCSRLIIAKACRASCWKRRRWRTGHRDRRAGMPRRGRSTG